KGVIAICDLIVPPGTGEDTKARDALASRTNYVSRADADQERRMVAAVLAKALVKSSDKEVTFFIINQLQFVGGDESVPVLAKYLDDERLCDAASGALLVMGSEAAEKAFLKALPSTSAKHLPMIVHALGQLKSTAAAGPLAAYVTSPDAVLRRVAIQSLGHIGAESSIQVLAEAAQVDNAYEKGLAASAYVQLAHRLSQEGYSQACVKLCRQVLQKGNSAYATNIQCQALNVLTQVKGLNATADLFAAVDGNNPTLQAAALRLAENTSGSRATVKWLLKLKAVSSDRQVEILAMLGRRGDKVATPGVREFLGHKDSAIRLAALTTLVQLDDTASVLDLVHAMQAAHADEIQAIKSLLMQVSTEPMIAGVLEILPHVSADKQVVLIDILAERESSVAVGAVFALTASADSKVNVAATKALAKMASQDDLPRLVLLLL
ncbi:MAG: HEAT repeat domain-containing protein, partial [Planctomycetes bacterium]|nr:HEAT repeat domain-containing protein [Planctomycetota bacterium]